MTTADKFGLRYQLERVTAVMPHGPVLAAWIFLDFLNMIFLFLVNLRQRRVAQPG
jgi:hypothetical protein